MHDDMAHLFGALADPTREKVVRLLSKGARRAGELATESGSSPSTMSRHLRVLLDAGIVTDERPADDARVRVFRLRGDSIGAVQAWLDELQAHGDAQLASFKRHVERTGRA